jgi:hypothetical protein
MEECLIENCLRYFEEMQEHKQQMINKGAHDYSLLNALLKVNAESARLTLLRQYFSQNVLPTTS